MTPAINLLKKKGIKFDVLSYEHEPNQKQFGLEAVEKLNLPAAQVFKTLVVEDNTQNLFVAVVPVSQQLNLKMLAKNLSLGLIHKIQNENHLFYLISLKIFQLILLVKEEEEV